MLSMKTDKIDKNKTKSRCVKVKKKNINNNVINDNIDNDNNLNDAIVDEYEKDFVGTDRHNEAIKILNDVFGCKAFRPEQYKIINNVLDGNDVICVMPTGYGKSLCFQLPPLLTKEVSIVISPLIALMNDQQMSMTNIGVKSCCYNSTITEKRKKELESEMLNGDYQIIYITPESLDKQEVRTLIDKIYEKIGICMVAIDEAHCVSSYGFDFRPKYREIVKIRDVVEGVPVLALTATATVKVKDDIIKCLNMKNSMYIKTSFDRPNLTINIKHATQNTLQQICDLIQNCNGSSIIYCLTKKETDNMNKKLLEKGIKSCSYHGDLKKTDREIAQQKFMNEEVDCICATIAFGMGINKSNVRLVVHYGCPKNIESYYQEIGRAGRDSKESECWMFYKQNDFRIQQLFIDKINDPVYKDVSVELLKTMIKYTTSKTCRRKGLLKYFSENYTKNNCGKCDNCCCTKQSVAQKDESSLFKILSTVFQLETEHNYNIGKRKLILVMRGSNSKEITDKMRNLTYYGAYKDISLKEVTRLVDMAIEYEYLKSDHIGDNIIVIKCTDYGKEFGEKYEAKMNS